MWCFAVLLMGLGRVFTPVRTCSQSGRIAGSFTNFSGSSSQRGQDLTAVCRSQSGVTKHQKMFSYRLFLYRHGSLEAIRTVRNKDDLSLKGNNQKKKKMFLLILQLHIECTKGPSHLLCVSQKSDPLIKLSGTMLNHRITELSWLEETYI